MPESQAIFEQIKFFSKLSEVPFNATDESSDPIWNNRFLSFMDAISIYWAVQSRNAKVYLEIGSGNSTKFARKAIRDGKLDTRIITIDPSPRAEVDVLCDRVIRTSLGNAPLEEIIDELQPGDVLFFDGSHRCLQNSDVTIFFIDLLWKIPKGVLVGIHDIFLPYDYPVEWMHRNYSEQYVLATALLAAPERFKVKLPLYHLNSIGATQAALGEFYKSLQGPSDFTGFAFWFELI